jgi:hypothetical protein
VFRKESPVSQSRGFGVFSMNMAGWRRKMFIDRANAAMFSTFSALSQDRSLVEIPL